MAQFIITWGTKVSNFWSLAVGGLNSSLKIASRVAVSGIQICGATVVKGQFYGSSSVGDWLWDTDLWDNRI